VYHTRTAEEADIPTLYELHRSAMHDYVDRTWGWDEDDQVARFHHYASALPLQVIEVDGQPARFLHIEYTADAVEIVNIELASTAQGRGIGTELLKQAIADAGKTELPLRLQVLKANRAAQRLYVRLGFEKIGETETHVRMQWGGGLGK
jgi:ribosomal protein S18 acetylase RimI-like enzyme